MHTASAGLGSDRGATYPVIQGSQVPRLPQKLPEHHLLGCKIPSAVTGKLLESGARTPPDNVMEMVSRKQSESNDRGPVYDSRDGNSSVQCMASCWVRFHSVTTEPFSVESLAPTSLSLICFQGRAISVEIRQEAAGHHLQFPISDSPPQKGIQAFPQVLRKQKET